MYLFLVIIIILFIIYSYLIEIDSFKNINKYNRI